MMLIQITAIDALRYLETDWLYFLDPGEFDPELYHFIKYDDYLEPDDFKIMKWFIVLK